MDDTQRDLSFVTTWVSQNIILTELILVLNKYHDLTDVWDLRKLIPQKSGAD